ncbi:MAG: CubicO group peptidase (beta-lactamase class C family) [bacterium]|jgi:CubicO group peptidase (beta-lactamase class C family)
MNYYKLLLLLLIVPYSNLFAQTYVDFSNEERLSVFKQWNLDNWDDGGEISRYIFLNMPEFWTHATIRRTGNVKSLKEDYRKEIAELKVNSELGEMTLQDYVKNSEKVDGMIILQGDRIVYEAYPRMLPNDRHLYWSVSKVFASTLIAILEDKIQLDVTKPVEHYLPELKGSGWENVPVIDILDMASGIDCREWVDGAYDNPETCYYQFEAALGWLKRTEKTADNAFEHIKTLSSAKPSGEIFEYTSANTFVLSSLVERVTGLSYAENIEREIWRKIGAETDALITQSDGTSLSHAGINSTLRDLARFGYMFLEDGRSADNAFVSNEYFDKIQKQGRPHLVKAFGSEKYAMDKEVVHHNTYQWDKVMEDGDFYKGGFSGQGLYISPSNNLVIAFFGTADENGVSNELEDISRQISKSDLIDKQN